MLSTELKDLNILCCTEHWLHVHEIVSYHIKNFKLSSSFCRTRYKIGRSDIFVKENKICKEKNQTYYLNEEKTFVACIHRSPDGCIETYLENFEILLNSLKSKGKPLTLSWDFHINFLINDSIVSEFRTIIHSHNLAETIHTPTRVTLNSQTCLDQIIIDQDLNPFKKDNMNMGISDHHAIFLYKHVNTKLI